ncbi:MAG: beta-propeller domain-containing protein [Candidatus Peribacteraceae bacterium]
MKRPMTWLILASVALSLSAGFVPAFAADNPFSDVPVSSPNAQAIRELKAENVLQGYADGTFKPGASINRAELLKIILEARADGAAVAGSACFPDVQGQWYAKYVCAAKSEGIVAGYDDGFFRPEKAVSFAEAAKIFSLAYKQQIRDASGEWYAGFIRALESSNAIPTSIDGLTEPLNRGDMAEMMWRLKKGVTDQPSKGYMNVKYPAVKVNLASDKVQVASSCTDLQAFSVELHSTTGGWGRGGGVMKEMLNAQDATAPTAAPAPTESGAGGSDGDYSRTNVQVEGVDEADIVKSDGTYLYIVSRNKVRIVKAVPGNTMKEMGSIFDGDSNFSPAELYIDGNRLVVVGSSWSQTDPAVMEKRIGGIIPPYWNPSLAQVRIFNVADKAKPVLERKVSFEGSSVSTRMIGHKLYFVVNQPMRWLPQPLTKPTDADVLPSFQDSRTGDASAPVVRCGEVMILPHVPSPEYLTVAVIDTASPSTEVQRETVLGNAQNIYASLQNLYVATTQWVYYWNSGVEDSIKAPDDGNYEKTNLYRFAFTADGIELKAQGSVPGHILNQFSMDEHENTFRIATTKGELWNEQRPATNNLYVLNQSLETAGKIEDIAPGERIYSVRFMGDRAYMVTFRNTDPLFVISTADPRNPRILGQLKIPGYSDYLHPYDENHLIGFGKDTEESKDRADFAWYQGMKLAVFDVTDVANPREMHKEIIGDRGTDSPLLSNHKALLFDKERNLLAFPVTVYEISESEKAKNDPGSYGQPVFQGAYVYDFTLSGGFKLKGTISHFTQDQMQKMGDVWYGLGRDIQRIVRLGSSLLTVSEAVVQSNTLSTLNKEGSVEFSDIDDQVYPCGRGVPCAVPMRAE